MIWSGQIVFGGHQKNDFSCPKTSGSVQIFFGADQNSGPIVESAIPNTTTEGILTFYLAGTYTQITQHTVARRLTSKKLNERFWERL